MGSRLDDTAMVSIVLALKLNHDVTQSMENFAEYNLMPGAAVQALAPSDETILRVKTWLQSVGAQPQLSSVGDFARVTLSLSEAEALFPKARFHKFVHKDTQKVIVRSIAAPELPPGIVQHLDATEGICDFPRLRVRQPRLDCTPHMPILPSYPIATLTS